MSVASVASRLRRRPPGYRYSIGRILAIYSGLMAIVLMASLDQTIVATALPHIVSDLGGLSSYSWVFTAFLLCQTITVPVYGKLGDVFGRRPLLLTAIGIFLAGSVLCGVAQNMVELIVFRGLQGVGAGGLIPLVIATVGELVPPRDRGRYQGLISGSIATSAIMGPAAGGLIVDHASWRWIFYVNLPIGVVALTVIVATMPPASVRREHAIDYVGATLFAGCSGAFLLALAWGGGVHPWGSTQVLGALAVSAVLLAGFLVVERRVPEPILPFDLLRQPIVATGALSACLAAMCMFGTIAFVPLFVQGVIGTSATSSAVVLTPFMLGAVTASISSGQWVSRTGRYRANALLGPVVLGTGMFLLWRMHVGTTTGEAARNMFVSGLGMGLMMQVFTVAAQNAVAPRVLGTATALLQFTRAIGTTLGVTLFGTIVNQGLPLSLRGQGTVLHRLSGEQRVRLAAAFHPAFLLAISACVLIFLAVLAGLKEKPLRTSFDDETGFEASAAVPLATREPETEAPTRG